MKTTAPAGIDWPGRSLAAFLLAAAGLAIWGENVSPVAAALRDGTPIIGLISARFAGQGRVVPSALTTTTLPRGNIEPRMTRPMPMTPT